MGEASGSPGIARQKDFEIKNLGTPTDIVRVSRR